MTNYAQDWPSATPLFAMMVSEKALADLPDDVEAAVRDEFAKIQSEIGARLYDEMVSLTGEMEEEGVEFIAVDNAEKNKAISIAKEAVWNPWLERTGEPGQALIDEIQQKYGQ